MSSAEFWVNLVLICLVGGIGVSLWRFHKSDRYQNFNLVDLITSRSGHIDRPAVQEIGVFILMSWGFVALVVHEPPAVPEWYVTVWVGFFVARAAHAAHLASKNKDEPKP